jgi:hypothetical protein
MPIVVEEHPLSLQHDRARAVLALACATSYVACVAGPIRTRQACATLLHVLQPLLVRKRTSMTGLELLDEQTNAQIRV